MAVQAGVLRLVSLTRVVAVQASYQTTIPHYQSLSHSISLSQTTFQCYCTMPISSRVHRQIVHLVGLLVTIIIPTLLQVIYALNDKEPYHTSLLSGEGWVQELLNGHPKRIRCELGVTKHVFQQLMAELHVMGYQRSKYVSLEEQLAIFLYTSVTGLTIQHVGERFQRSNETISK